MTQYNFKTVYSERKHNYKNLYNVQETLNATAILKSFLTFCIILPTRMQESYNLILFMVVHLLTQITTINGIYYPFLHSSLELQTILLCDFFELEHFSLYPSFFLVKVSFTDLFVVSSSLLLASVPVTISCKS